MELIDLHQDISSARSHPVLKRQTDFNQLKKAHAKIVFGTGFALPEEKLTEVVARDFGFYAEHCKQNPQWSLIRTKEDMQTVMSNPASRGILFHIEGFPGFDSDWTLLDRWFEQGLRSAGLVWNDDNFLGGGTNSDVGLAEAGREFIARAEAKGILIDLAHANQTIFEDCLEAVKNPPFVSHGGLYSLVPNRRNCTDSQLKEVVDRGGIVGIFLAKSCMTNSGSFSMEDIVKHIHTAVELLGEDAVAIGTDFGGMISGAPEGLSTISHVDNLWRNMRSGGLSERQIEKIARLNAERYIMENLP